MKNAFYFPVTHNATFGERITILRKSKGIKSVQGLAEEIFEKLEKYTKTGVPDTDNATIEGIRKRIASHLKPNCNPKMEFIKEYCDFFQCEADFLLGYIDFPTKENQSIHEITGLNDSAIETLSSWYEYQKNMKRDYQEQIYFPIETLNILLSDSDMEWLLRGIQDLLKSNYKIPAYHNGEWEVANINEKYNKCLTPKYIVPDSDYDVIKGHNGFNDLYLLTLVQDKTKTWDNTQIVLDDDFFEAVAIKTIEKYLRAIRNNYLNERTDKKNETT